VARSVLVGSLCIRQVIILYSYVAWKRAYIFTSDVMLPMPKSVGWTRDIKFIKSWLDAYVEMLDLGLDELKFDDNR